MTNQSISRLPNTEFKPFRLGKIVVTPGSSKLQEKGIDFTKLLDRHISGDWGDVCLEDWEENNFSSINGFRIFSVYETKYGKIYIVTEHDRSVTTFLLPSEY